MHCGYPRRRRRGADRRAGRAAGRGRAPVRRRSSGSAEENGAFEIRIAADDAERALFWKGRKSAFAAVGRISPDYIVQDGVIPRTALPRGAAPHRRARPPSTASGWPTSSTPATATCTRWCCSTRPVPGEAERAEEVSGAILDLCIEHGGSITGEHGVGVGQGQVHAAHVHRRRPRHDAAGALRVRPATGSSNPGKIFPTPAPVRRGPGRHKGVHPLAGRPAWRKCSDDERQIERLWTRCATLSAMPPAGDARRRRGRRPVRPTSLARERRPRRRRGAPGRRRRDGLAVVPRGGGTKLDWGAAPERLDLILDTSRLDEVRRARRRRPVVDRAGRVRRWPSVQSAVARRSAAGPGRRRSPGRNRRRHGRGQRQRAPAAAVRRRPRPAHRRHVVRADGVIAKAGGKVVKNVAGYDLGKLFAGSCGTLGVITECAFRLHPLPSARRWVTVDAQVPTTLRRLVHEVAALRSSCRPRSSSTSAPAVRRCCRSCSTGCPRASRRGRPPARAARQRGTVA